MCFLSDFSIEKQLSQTLKVEAVDQPIFFSKTLTTGWFSLHHIKSFFVKFQEVQPEQSSLLSSRYSLCSQARLENFKFKKIIHLPKIYLLDFDLLILIVRHELPDAARHVTRRRARPPMQPFRKLGLVQICSTVTSFK